MNRIRAALVLTFLALPAHANEILVCATGDGWEVTVAFPQDGGCIVDNVGGEAAREDDVVTCTTEDPEQHFVLGENNQFAYSGPLSYPEVEEQDVYRGDCTRS